MGRCFGADIGGTLAKIVYFEQVKNTPFMNRPRSLSHDLAEFELREFVIHRESYGKSGYRDIKMQIPSAELGGTLHFIQFESRGMKNAIDLISHHGINQSIRMVSCTGGGAQKFEKLFLTDAGIALKKCDEIECTIKGLNFLLNLFPNEIYTFENVDFKTLVANRVQRPRLNADTDIFPYMLVSIGSGVSILHVRSTTEFKRVSGSSIGGDGVGTYWGLCKLLTYCSTYEEALDLAESGNNFGVDMSVGDIYGGSYDRFQLPASTVASSFGKVVTQDKKNQERIEAADIARSLLVMITQNIGQLAYLHARLFKTKRIVFVGNFLRHNKISCRTMAYAINFWSRGAMEAQFCVHEGYLGALGAFLHNAEYRRRSFG